MKTLKLFIFLLSFYAVLAVYADDESKQATEVLKDQKTNTKTEKSASKRNKVKTLEEFIPSEEVSADKPVAFPVDI